MILSICIPTILGREQAYERLESHIWQMVGDRKGVEVLMMQDNKELTIGAKRQQLLDACEGQYVVMVDDDDDIDPSFIESVLPMLGDVDCCTYRESVRINGREHTCNHSIKYADWGSKQDGYDFVRTPYYKDVIKTEIARKVGFKSVRYGEDHIQARALKPLLKTEAHIDRVMYYYYGKTLSAKEHKERYGIR